MGVGAGDLRGTYFAKQMISVKSICIQQQKLFFQDNWVSFKMNKESYSGRQMFVSQSPMGILEKTAPCKGCCDYFEFPLSAAMFGDLRLAWIRMLQSDCSFRRGFRSLLLSRYVGMKTFSILK